MQAKSVATVPTRYALPPDPPDSCIIDSLPYTSDFASCVPNSPAFIPCWHRLNPWVYDISGSIYISQGYNYINTITIKRLVSNSKFQLVSLPMIDSAIVADNDLMMTIRYYHNLSNDASIPITIGALGDPTDTSGFRSFAQLPVTTNIQEMCVRLDSLEPNEYLTIKTRIRDYNETVRIQEVSLDEVPPCGKVYDMTCGKRNNQNAYIRWRHLPNKHCDSTVFIFNAYRSSDSTLLFSDTTRNTYMLLHDLTPNTNYSVTVMPFCPDCETYSPHETLNFQTTLSTSTCILPLVIATEICEDSITIEWTPDSNNSLWNIYYYTQVGSSGVWSLLDSNHNGTSYTFLHPESGRIHKFRVNAQCNLNDAVTANTVSVAMPCHPITELPFTEGFDNFDPYCWIRSSNFYVISIHQHRALSFYPNRTCELPEIAHPINSLTVSGEIHGDYLVVGVKTTDNRYIPIDTVRTRRENAWESFVVDLASYPYTDGRITLWSVNSSTMTTCVDNLVVDYTPSCPQPYSVFDSVLSNSSVMVEWRAAPGANVYELEYGPRGFRHGEGTSMYVTIDSTVITGLNHSTVYDLYIRSFCSTRDTSQWSFPITFTTPCSDIASMPYTEDFCMWYNDNASWNIPPCWNGNLDVVKTLLPSGDTTCSLQIFDRAFAPRLSRLLRLQTLQVRFTTKYFCNNSDHIDLRDAPKILVGASTSTTTGYINTAIDTFTLTTTPTTYEVSFNNYTDSGRYVTFTVLNDNPYLSNSDVVYLDDVTIDYPPDCMRPDRLAITNATGTQAEISWRERGEAEHWQIEYGPQGFSPGTGTLVTTADNPCVIDSLSPGTAYECRVRSLCNAGAWHDTSEWSLATLPFSTLQPPAQIPYYCNFEDSTEALRWNALCNTDIAWLYQPLDNTPPSNGYKVGFDSTRYDPNTYHLSTFNSINATLYRDIDFGSDYSPEAENRYTITFRSKAALDHSGYGSTLKAMVCLLDPRYPDSISSLFMVSPWGHTDTLNTLSDTFAQEYWHTDTIQLDTIHGVRRLAFFFSYGVGRMVSSNTALSIDDINIFPTPCPQPLHVQIDTLTDSLAAISWTGSSSARYLVTCRSYHLFDTMTTVVFSDTVADNHTLLEGLSPANRYAVEIRRICDGNEMSLPSPTLYFITNLCDSLRVDSFEADSANTRQSSIMPISSADYSSYSQQIFPASGFSGAGFIHAINLHYLTYYPHLSINNYSVYLGLTSKTSFANANDFVDPEETTLCYVGPLPPSDGWGKIVLDSPFEYDGVSNLVLAILSNGNTSKPLHTTVVNTPQNMSVEIRGNGVIDASSLQAIHDFTGSRNAFPFHCQASFDFCPACSCPRPELLPPSLYYRHVVLRWRDMNTDTYEYCYKLSSETEWNVFRTADTSVEIFNIVPEQEYTYRVRQLCPNSSVTNWTYGQFRTAVSGCPPPDSLYIISLTPDETTLQWSHDEDNLSYNIHLFNSSFDTILTTENSQITIHNLLHGVTYHATVQAKCSTTRPAGNWCDTIEFTTPTCPNATDLSYSDLHSTSVVLDWNTDDTISRWEIAYGAIGFHQYHGTNVLADHHPFTLTGLTPGEGYDAYVRSICGTNFYSEQWSNVVTFTTLNEGIDSPDASETFTLSPNPASDHITISLTQPSQSPVDIILRDAHGRTINHLTIPPHNTSGEGIRLPLHSPAGIYFVTLITPRYTATRKFIIK